jgi:hypothetical protein
MDFPSAFNLVAMSYMLLVCTLNAPLSLFHNFAMRKATNLIFIASLNGV